MDKLSGKLKNDFDVTLFDANLMEGKISTKLAFKDIHTDNIKRNLKLLGLNGIKTSAEIFAKQNNYVLPFIQIEEVQILNDNPYEFKIIAPTSLVYFFVYKLLYTN
ncbi:hypothetical protein [Bacillus thuringiensis]|uniref:hypothetical protein n=1 Tax=Bacillus thuringiensis TaxID=1428 RepID=UPI000BF95EDE|nr:hypothetical protein [Bacillus thuringiensis]PEY78848.1 hypothetical protein CN351_30235 [Bacillus thuringiensis]PFE59540.1 hypothetical protein CN322_28810 [Bacillus thuringiensis]PFI42757.1 hypothetical protein COI77_00345 [Bacillus thuringiensis]PFW19515.1 hypothetical protein COL19_29445 [Bacillus thuringiensis]PGQ25556.1 hypothetical protein COA11_17900 [Bacillus thuringiensis]